MPYTQNRTEQRQFLANAWQKFLSKQRLEPLEKQLVQIIELHPEYHALISNVELDYLPESGKVNPFLHINLHLSLHQQLSINQPKGIQDCYQKLLNKIKDSHPVEHLMMDCIAEMVFLSQKNNVPMNYQAYMQCLEAQCGV